MNGLKTEELKLKENYKKIKKIGLKKDKKN